MVEVAYLENTVVDVRVCRKGVIEDPGKWPAISLLSTSIEPTFSADIVLNASDEIPLPIDSQESKAFKPAASARE